MTSSIFFSLSELAYMMAMVGYIAYLVFKRKGIGVAASAITIFGFSTQTMAIIKRWIESYPIKIVNEGDLLSKLLHSAPFSNLYESLILFTWTIILSYLIIEFRYKNRSFGAFVTPIAGIVLLFIDLTGMSKDIQPLMPALRSNWLIAHVILSFIAYATFAISFSTAIMYLIMTAEKRNEGFYIFWTSSVGLFLIVLIAMAIDFMTFRVAFRTPETFIKSYLFRATFLNQSTGISIMSWIVASGVLFLLWRFGYLLKRVLDTFSISIDTLDDITYKSIAVGFPVFGLGGLIFGGVWAAQAWGTYWSWDPKETWSLITWLVYAIYLHARVMRGWKGKKAVVIASVGFLIVIFTYLGVNLLLSGLHAYGEL
ncbi:MAG: c-type cytochrome biogenesis protein CcsB [Nitrospirota bacterium]